MDLANIAVNLDAMPVELRHPQTAEVLKDKDGNPFTVLVHGQDSEPYKKHARKILNGRLKGKNKDMNVEAVEKEATETLVSLTAGWSGMVMNGKPLAYSADAARGLYSDPQYPWLREQIETFIADRSNFLPKSPEI